MASWASNKTAIHEYSNQNCLKKTLSRSNQHQSLLILARDLRDVIFHAFNLTVSHEHTHVAAIKKDLLLCMAVGNSETPYSLYNV